MNDEARTNHVAARDLSAYLDGDLPAEREGAVEAHLSGCAGCRRALDELRALVEEAGALRDRPPEGDLWPGIADAIEALPERAEPRAVPVAGPRRAPRGVRLSISQLAAAALALILLSGGGVWLARPGAPAGSPEAGALSSGTEGARSVSLGDASSPESYADELEALERALREHGGELDPNTVRILKKNLAVIDRAIRESREALAVDPGNAFLESHLEQAYRTRLRYLQEAARLVEWTS